MRYKVVPPAPADLSTLAEARRAVPLVPGTVEDCCTRIRDRVGLPARDDAREWLTFMQALDLAAETDRGFRRRDDREREALARAFRERVFGAREVLDHLADAPGPVEADSAFEAVRDEVPAWERSRAPDWEDTWRERVGHLLEWAVLLGLAERADGGYRPSDGPTA